jgi:hypothetical protein
LPARGVASHGESCWPRAELPWQPEGEEEEGGWSGKSLITMWWLPTSQSSTTKKKKERNPSLHKVKSFSELFHSFVWFFSALNNMLYAL